MFQIEDILPEKTIGKKHYRSFIPGTTKGGIRQKIEDIFMKLSLVVLSAGKAEGQTLKIPLPQFLIGRDPQCHLRPASPMISKRHCALIQKGEKAFVRDFASLNGTFVNEEKVDGQRELHDKDILKVGPLLFRVKLEGVTPTVDKPTPPPANKEPASAEGGDEESMAAMLLSSIDGDEPVLSPSTGAEDEVPGGTTEMDLGGLSETDQPESSGETNTEGDKEEEPKMNTAEAAAAALQAYARRNRR